jgi:hypothetical protein
MGPTYSDWKTIDYDFYKLMGRVRTRHHFIFHGRTHRVKNKNFKLYKKCRIEFVKRWFKNIGGVEL